MAAGPSDWAILVDGGVDRVRVALCDPPVGFARQCAGGADTPLLQFFFTVLLVALGAYYLSLWVVFLPVLAALPAGDSVAVDRLRGVDAVMITRVGWRNYLWGRWFGSAGLAATATAIALGLTAVVAAIGYPLALPRLLGWRLTPALDAALPYKVKVSGVFADGYPPAFHPHFFWAAPGLYLVAVGLLALWATVAVAGLAIAGSVWLRRPVLTLAVPAALFWIADFLAEDGPLAPSQMAGGYLYEVHPPQSWGVLVLYWLVPVGAVALILAWVTLRRKEWPQRSRGQ